MYNLDSLSLKYLINQNKNFFDGAVVQKIQMPSKREILLSIRNLGENRKLYINVNPKFPHLNFIENKENYSIKIPKEPPMFCMLLRKHLEGAKLKDVRVVNYERIVEFYFDIYDEIGFISPMCLAIELMGKHSNAILYNAQNKIITGCIHNISPEKSSVREVWGGINYIYPPKQDKKDILKTSISEFYNLPFDEISSKYYYLSYGVLDFALGKNFKEKEELFSYLQNLVSNGEDETKAFWQKNIKDSGMVFNLSMVQNSLNSLIETYFSHFVMQDLMQMKKNALLKTLNKEIKRQNDIILNSEKKNSYLNHKQKGDAILTNIYKIKTGDKKLIIDSETIDLDPYKTPSENAQYYFNLYSKGKKAQGILKERCNKAKENLNYLNDIMFSIENADRPEILEEIGEELGEFLNSTLRNVSSVGKIKNEKPNVQTLEYQGFTIYIGKNNKQNDYLIKKISSPEDIWLHGKDCPSGHIFIKTDNGKKPVTDEVLLYAAQIAKQNSPMKNSAKASIIYTKRKFIKRPPDTHLGYVTYREEKEIVV